MSILATLKLRPPGAARNVFSERQERGVRKVVIQDLPKTIARFSHGPCAALTKADAVSLAGSFEDHLPALLARGETVAGHSIPSKTPVDRKSSGFAFSGQRGVL